MLLESIPPHIQNWPFIFSDLRMPLLTGCPPTRQQYLWVVKGTEGNQSGDGVCFIVCDGLAHHLRLDSEHLYNRGLVAQKGNLENADSPAGQLLATHATAEFNVLTRGNA